MPTVTFYPSGKSITVENGTTLFDAAHRVSLPVASSCSAEYVCGKCNMTILGGDHLLSPQTTQEKNLLIREKKTLSDRISCMTQIRGDCTVTTSYW